MLDQLKKDGLAGATVTRGIAGFGAIGLRAVTDRELSGALASPSLPVTTNWIW